MNKIPENTKYWQDIPLSYDNINTPLSYGREVLMKRGKNIALEIENLGLNKDAKILEIGCNCGRNLEYLRRVGYKNLTGNDINKYAFEHMSNIYPELFNNIEKKIGAMENISEELDEKYDIVFTMAVLMHLDTKQRDVIYNWLKNNAKYIIIIEPYSENATKVKIKDGRLLDHKIDARNKLESLGFNLIKFDKLQIMCGLDIFKVLIMNNTKIQ
jgi:SAM-dependent methyltransferase